jgi:hypothetical protein
MVGCEPQKSIGINMKVKDIIGGQSIFKTDMLDPDIFRIGNDFQFDLGL